eukprot:gene13879-13998_t
MKTLTIAGIDYCVPDYVLVYKPQPEIFQCNWKRDSMVQVALSDTLSGGLSLFVAALTLESAEKHSSENSMVEEVKADISSAVRFEIADQHDKKLRHDVRAVVGDVWDPYSLACFINRFGTHIITSADWGKIDLEYAVSCSSQSNQVQSMKAGGAVSSDITGFPAKATAATGFDDTTARNDKGLLGQKQPILAEALQKYLQGGRYLERFKLMRFMEQQRVELVAVSEEVKMINGRSLLVATGKVAVPPIAPKEAADKPLMVLGGGLVSNIGFQVVTKQGRQVLQPLVEYCVNASRLFPDSPVGMQWLQSPAKTLAVKWCGVPVGVEWVVGDARRAVPQGGPYMVTGLQLLYDGGELRLAVQATPCMSSLVQGASSDWDPYFVEGAELEVEESQLFQNEAAVQTVASSSSGSLPTARPCKIATSALQVQVHSTTGSSTARETHTWVVTDARLVVKATRHPLGSNQLGIAFKRRCICQPEGVNITAESRQEYQAAVAWLRRYCMSA